MELNDQKIEVLSTAHDYLGKLINGVSTTATKFQTGNENEGTNLTLQIIDGLNWLLEALALTKDIQKGEIDVNVINGYLLEMNEALENTDYVLLADLLQYELSPVLEEWYLVVTKSLGD